MPRLTNNPSKSRCCALRQSSTPSEETQRLVRRARAHSQLSEAKALDVAHEQVRAVRRRK